MMLYSFWIWKKSMWLSLIGLVKNTGIEFRSPENQEKKKRLATFKCSERTYPVTNTSILHFIISLSLVFHGEINLSLTPKHEHNFHFAINYQSRMCLAQWDSLLWLQRPQLVMSVFSATLLLPQGSACHHWELVWHLCENARWHCRSV